MACGPLAKASGESPLEVKDLGGTPGIEGTHIYNAGLGGVKFKDKDKDRLVAGLARRGITVGTHDLMIGATALARGFSIVTRDQRSFSRIPGLEIEDLH